MLLLKVRGSVQNSSYFIIKFMYMTISYFKHTFHKRKTVLLSLINLISDIYHQEFYFSFFKFQLFRSRSVHQYSSSSSSS